VDHSKLGRLALRLAWLFRELDGPALPVGSAEGGQVRSEALGALAEATERLDKLLQEAGENLREIQQHGKTRTEELRQGGSPEDNPYLPLGDLIEVRLQALQSEVTGLQMAVLQDQQGRSPAGAPVQEGAGSLVKELLAIAPSWPKLPRSERQSLKSALEAFQYSYQFEEEGDGVEQGMAQVNLILDILIRLGELEQALEWTSQISKYSSDTSTDLKNRLSKARATQTLSPYDSTAIHRKIAALSLTQQKAGEHRKDILRLMLERDREKIDAALERTAQLPIQERLNALREMGIHDGVLTLLSRELNPNPKENGGWFKGLFQG
jgi:tetratricopeptide (TPR) repeat protein